MSSKKHTILYGSPTNCVIVNPDPKILRDHLFHKPTSFLAPKSGIVELQIPPANWRRTKDVRMAPGGLRLIVARKDADGIMLNYESPETQMSMAAIKSTDFSKMTVLSPAGIRWPLPVALFLPKEQAWLGIVEFMETGKCPTS